MRPSSSHSMAAGLRMSGSAANVSIRKPGSIRNVLSASAGLYGGRGLPHPARMAAASKQVVRVVRRTMALAPSRRARGLPGPPAERLGASILLAYSTTDHPNRFRNGSLPSGWRAFEWVRSSSISNLDSAIRPLHLSPEEKHALAAFLGTLNGRWPV